MTILDAPPSARLSLIELEITGQCQARCVTCYNRSGPQGAHGAMGRADWCHVIDQAAGLGVQRLQFIGGEPTLHPDLAPLVRHALSRGIAVEVFSNLIHVRPHLWEVFARQGVSLATSYYSDQAAEHEQITRHRSSYDRTKANISEAVRLGIPIRAGVIRVLEGQRVKEAVEELRGLGVERIGVDRVRRIGRGAGDRDGHDPAELCGHCTRGRAAVLPTGEAVGCGMSRWMSAGNVLTTPLADIITSPEWQQITAAVPAPRSGACVPESCTPKEDSCQPSPGIDPCVPNDSPCQPAKPACLPKLP
ncbi:radical SAM protein [Streptomyces silvisoli]|uniref:Radical SAM protein n=1 Tax=Streptomyces silvisoli TaxID=3034235 RepID=A0ABT5ZQ06_9ACTN|nr:radical SAM protein [Streptomyces silvisoli]MDF3291920.1 radical SAM protein [Streptomyces silvisoli]